MKRAVSLIAVLAIALGVSFAGTNPKNGSLPCGKYVAQVIKINVSGATESLQSFVEGYNAAAQNEKASEKAVIETKASVETVAELPAEYAKWLNDETIDKRTKVIIEDNQIVILNGADDKEVFKFKDAKFSKGVWKMVAENGETLTLKEEKGGFILHTDFCDYNLTKQ